MNQQGIDRFNDGVQALLLSQPFFGTLLMKMRHVPEDGIGTLYVDGVHIGYDPEFMAKQSIAQAQFCIGHEVLHAAWMHLDRIRHYLDVGIGPDGQPLDQQLFNMALDFPINASLVESKIGEMPAGIEICHDPRKYPATMTPEEVYCDLKQQGKGGKGGGGGGGASGSGNGQPLDVHKPKPGDSVDGVTAADVQQAANVCKAMRGTLPAGIDRLLGEIKKPASSPWRRLRRAVTSALSGYDASTWRRLQRRMIVRGIGMPGRVAQGAGTIGVVADTSGSIDEAMLNLFFGHMAAIMDDARPQLVHVYWTDAKVHRRDTVKNSTDLRRMAGQKVPGGGGTDMPEGVQAAEEDGCDCIVVLTDGYTPFCASKRPTVWAITSQQKSPYGETIHIN